MRLRLPLRAPHHTGPPALGGWAGGGGRLDATLHAPLPARVPGGPAGALLTGRPGAEGLRYRDGFGQTVLQAAPGLLGLLESRPVVERWKPEVVGRLDAEGGFFDHLAAELGGEPAFDGVAGELDQIRRTDAPPASRGTFLFRYLALLAAGLEDPGDPRLAPTRVRVRVPGAAGGPARLDVPLGGPWLAYRRAGPGAYVEDLVVLPVNWELLAGVANHAGAMRFTRAVHLPAASAGTRVVLAFDGVDYFADVWWNGHHAGGHEGAFGPFELDVTPFLRWGAWNLLRVTATSPDDPSGPGIGFTDGWDDFAPSSAFPNRKTLVKGTLGHHDARRGGAWSPISGQDGNTGGVWNDVTLRVRGPVRLAGPAPRITTLALGEPSRAGERSAVVAMAVTVENAGRPVAGRLWLEVRPAGFAGPSHHRSHEVEVPEGRSDLRFEEHLDPIRPWQPWDQGPPHRYQVTVGLEAAGRDADTWSGETGFRTLSVDALGESSEPDGALAVNGCRVNVRATNLLPTYWLSEYDEARIERDLGLLLAAGFNAVIVHNLVGPMRFYRAAGGVGLLVFQMFPLQWSYDQSPGFVERAGRQIEEMADLLAGEPAVVSYEVHNEPDIRTCEDLDNRVFDFDLHARLRARDPSRWATTYAGGNHVYPGQFYDLRDDNSFETLPGRFCEDTFAGRRFARHRNLPTEFGLQAMPGPDLFAALLGEDRVRAVLARLRTDPKWLAGGGEPLEAALGVLGEATRILGGGSWAGALAALDWRHLWEQVEGAGGTGAPADPAMGRLAAVVLEVLRYGGFKDESLRHGRWRPARTAEEFAAASQQRQYRLHKDAVENYLDAAACGGPIAGYAGFMFRDADWQAPTWGVVDAAWVPKKAYRAYVESNQPVRVTLPQARRRPVLLPGDPWLAAVGHETPDRPWLDAEAVVANDTPRAVEGAQVDVWLESPGGEAVPFTDGADLSWTRYRFTINVGPQSGLALRRLPGGPVPDPSPAAVVPEGSAAGTYVLRARVTREGEEFACGNAYERVVLDTSFAWLAGAGQAERAALAAVARDVLDAGAGLDPGAEEIQGEHLFRRLVGGLAGAGAPADPLVEGAWTIRSEILSPAEKARALLAWLERFYRAATGAP